MRNESLRNHKRRMHDVILAISYDVDRCTKSASPTGILTSTLLFNVVNH